MEDLVCESSDLQIVLPVAVTVVCFCTYWFLAYSEKLKHTVNEQVGDSHFVSFGAFYQKGIGFLFLGVIPFAIDVFFLPGSFESYGLGAVAWKPALLWTLILGGVVMIVPYFSARKEEMLQFYPQVRVMDWSGSLLAVNAIVWLLYLWAYEFLFRGFLLMNTAEALGWWPAIVITTALSAVTHMPKGSKETFGTIPLSVLLCLIVVQTGAIWPCVIIHAMLAISNDYWAVTYHPQMKMMVGKSLKSTKEVIPD